jgi:hypothetical protein
LLEAVFFTACVSVRLNRRDNLYENSAVTARAAAARAIGRVMTGDSASAPLVTARQFARAAFEENR